jgi:hypothetical protein
VNGTWTDQILRTGAEIVIPSAAVGGAWGGVTAAVRREPIARSIAIGALTSAAFGVVATVVIVGLRRSGVIGSTPETAD